MIYGMGYSWMFGKEMFERMFATPMKYAPKRHFPSPDFLGVLDSH